MQSTLAECHFSVKIGLGNLAFKIGIADIGIQNRNAYFVGAVDVKDRRKRPEKNLVIHSLKKLRHCHLRHDRKTALNVQVFLQMPLLAAFGGKQVAKLFVLCSKFAIGLTRPNNMPPV